MNIDIPLFDPALPSMKNLYWDGKLWKSIKSDKNDKLYYIWMGEATPEEKDLAMKEYHHGPKSKFSPTTEVERIMSVKRFHDSCGHPGKPRLKLMIEKYTQNGSLKISDIGNLKDFDCQECVEASIKQSRYPSLIGREYDPYNNGIFLEQDLTGKSAIPAIGSRGRHASIIVERHSGMHDVEIIRTKDLGRVHLMKSVAYFENLTGEKVCYVKPDNSAESGRSNELKNWLVNNKIELKLPVEYAHETHGRAERAVQTNTVIALKLMVSSKLGIGYWGFARKYASILYNITPNDKDGLSPAERATGGENLDISFILKTTFGCDAILAIPTELRKNNQPQGKRGIYVGIDLQKLCWLVYVPSEQKTYSTRNVKFYPSNFSGGKGISDTALDEFVNGDQIPLSVGLDRLSEQEIYLPEEENLIDGINSSKKLALATVIMLANKILLDDIGERDLPGPVKITPISVGGIPVVVDLPEENLIIQPEISDGGIGVRESRRTTRFNGSYSDFFESDSDSEDYLSSSSKLNRKVETLLKVFVNNAIEGKIPRNEKDALSGKYPDWLKEMENELTKLKAEDSFEVVPRPKDAQVLPYTYVFVEKDDGRKRPRMCIRGDLAKQKKETYASVVHKTALKIVLAEAAINDWEIEVSDVTTAFANSPVEKDRYIYVEIPASYKNEHNQHPGNDKVLRLLKYIYGLCEASREWEMVLGDFLVKDQHYKKTEKDWSIYVRITDTGKSIICVHVDDMLITGVGVDKVQKLLEKRFKMKRGGWKDGCIRYVGWDIRRDRKHRTLTIDQEHYVEKIMFDYGTLPGKIFYTPMEAGFKQELDDGQETVAEKVPYASLVMTLQFIVQTRPEISTAVSILASYLNSAQEKHWNAAKRVLWYIIGTKSFGQVLGDLSNVVIEAWADASYANEPGCKSRIGGVVFYRGGVVSTYTKKTEVIAQSSMEAEIITMSEAAKKMIYIQQLLKTLGIENQLPNKLLGDNQSALKVAISDQIKERSRHINIRYLAWREYIGNGLITTEYVPTGEMIADLLTKPLARLQFEKLRLSMNVRAYATTVGECRELGRDQGFDQSNINKRPSEHKTVRRKKVIRN